MAAPRKYPLELRERAVRVYREADPKPVIAHLADQLGVHREALRGWIRADAAARRRGAGRPPRAAAVAAPGEDDVLAEVAALRKEVMELRRANEILKAASAYFAVQLDQTGRRF